MLGPFATASHLTPIHQLSLAVLSRAACASMTTTTTTTTTTTRDRGDRYGPMEWAQKLNFIGRFWLDVAGSSCDSSADCRPTMESTGDALCCQDVRRGRQGVRRICDRVTPISACIPPSGRK